MGKHLVAAAVLLALLPACAKSVGVKALGAQSPTGSGGTERPGASPTSNGSVERPAGTPSGSQAVSGSSSLPDSVPGMPKAPLTVTLAKTCLTPGSAQTLTVRSVKDFQVTWNTQYSDGGTHREYNGGGIGAIPPDGVTVFTWTIGPGAPLGQARTDVAVLGKIDGKDAAAFAHPVWMVAKSC